MVSAAESTLCPAHMLGVAPTVVSVRFVFEFWFRSGHLLGGRLGFAVAVVL